jgi:hypothetical protein
MRVGICTNENPLRSFTLYIPSRRQLRSRSEKGSPQVIPPKLWSLPLLGVVVLNDNSLTGQIPLPDDDSSKYAPNLIDVRLHGNELTGPIPAWFSQLTRLNTWKAGDNQLTGFLPPDPASSLNFLDLSWKNMTGPVPKELVQQMNYLYLEHNQLTGQLPSPKTSALKNL